MKFDFRRLKSTDLTFLKDMFYLSLYVPEGEPAYPRSIIDRPDLARYYQNWGQESDLGLLVENETELVGAVWSRFFTEANRGYGFVNEVTPEIGIALQEAYRGKGLGTMLLKKLLKELVWRGVDSVSLSVDKRNRAMGLYEKLGFENYRVEGNAVLMLKKI